MKPVTRRRFVMGGVAATAGVASVAVADRLARRYGLLPPDDGGIYGPGETLTYAAQRIFGGRSMAREFPRSMISKAPFANAMAPLNDAFKQQQASGFREWKLAVDGMVEHPGTFSLADLKAMTMRSQITEVACEEGWSYIAEWIGTPLAAVLREVGVQPQARYMVYSSIEPGWWDSLDIRDAQHPQTLLTWGMNDGDLPVGFGGPLRLRVPRQLGYKSVKFVTRLTLTDSMKGVKDGLGSAAPAGGYSWYAGI
ncbi:MAG: molybdopterin-dependent oxidoreductase [Acidobacteriaceae bacterium]